MPSSDLSRLKVICSCNGKAREARGARFGLEFPGWQTSRRVSHQRGLFDNDRQQQYRSGVLDVQQCEFALCRPRSRFTCYCSLIGGARRGLERAVWLKLMLDAVKRLAVRGCPHEPSRYCAGYLLQSSLSHCMPQGSVARRC